MNVSSEEYRERHISTQRCDVTKGGVTTSTFDAEYTDEEGEPVHVDVGASTNEAAIAAAKGAVDRDIARLARHQGEIDRIDQGRTESAGACDARVRAMMRRW